MVGPEAGCRPSTRPAATGATGAPTWTSFLERSGPGGASRGGPLVLIVDDDAGLRGFVRASLELEGYTVREAASADEGLAALEEEPPDLILLDVMMPQVDGWEMLRRVQERHGVGAIPVLMFSGKIDERRPPTRPSAARRASSASRSTRSS